MADKDSTIPTGWKMTTLGRQVKVGRGSSPRPIQDFISASGIPWVKIADASASETRYINKTRECIKEEGRSTTVKIGDLIVSNSATPGIPKFMGIDACVHDGWLVFSDYKDLDKLYLYYFFLDYRRTLEHSASGSVFVNLQTEIVKNIELNIPPFSEQRAIAAVLSSLDSKIELLREQNKTMEATSQAIFKEWFVNFNFPGATGKMVESELGEIPEVWRVGRLGDFGEIICGKTPSKDNRVYFGGKIPFIKIPDMHGQVFINKTEDSLTEEGAGTQTNKYIPKNSICVSCIATVGLVSITSEKSQTNQQINSIIPKVENYLEYLFLVLKNMKDDLLAIGTGGSATLNINTTTFSNIEVVFPENNILEKFHLAMSSIFRKLNFNNSQIQALSVLRDGLLPKLMKGQVRVDN